MSVVSTLAIMRGVSLTIQAYYCEDRYCCMGSVMQAMAWIGLGMARRNVSLG